MQKVKVAVVGYGYLGKWHTQKAAGLPESQLIAIVESDSERQKLARADHPGVLVVSLLDEVIDQIDAAVVVTPTSTHFDYIAKLLIHQKHILCEKPLCASPVEVKEIEKLLGEKDYSHLVLQCGHSERFHAVWDFGPTKEVCKSQNFVIEAKRQVPFSGRACDVDVVQDLMIHDLDLLNFILKRPPQSITARGYKLRTNNYDVVWAELSYDGGGKVYLEANRDYVKMVRSLDLRTGHLTCLVDLVNCDCQWLAHQDGQEAQKQAENYEKRDHLLLEQQCFYRSIQNHTAPIISFADGLSACHLAHKVLESIETQKTILL